MNLLARSLLWGILAWQAGAAALVLARQLRDNQGPAWAERLTADTATRVQRLLGQDAGLWRELRARLPAGAVVLSRLPTLANADEAAFRRSATLHNLRHLLYPDPFLARSVPDPVAQAEQLCPPGQAIWVIVLAGDPKPTATASWSFEHPLPGGELWRFRRA